MRSMLSRRSALAAGSAALLAPSLASAQGIARSVVVAGLTPIPRTAVHWVALFDELRKQGFGEGINQTIRGYGIAPDRLDAAAAEFVNAGVQAILSGGAGPTRAAQRATTAIPILTAVDDFIERSRASSPRC